MDIYIILVSKTNFSQNSSMGIYTGGYIYWRTTVSGMPAAGEKIMISVDHTHESARGECPPQARNL